VLSAGVQEIMGQIKKKRKEKVQPESSTGCLKVKGTFGPQKDTRMYLRPARTSLDQLRRMLEPMTGGDDQPGEWRGGRNREGERPNGRGRRD
jgi:hypothetical protein